MEVRDVEGKLYHNKDVLHKKLIIENKTQLQIAEEFGCSESTISLWANKLGITTRITKYLTEYETICLDWDYKRNERDIITITHGSRYRAHWRCHKCKHPWCIAVKARTLLESGCPNCAGRVVNDTNCLSTLYPKLIKEWDYDRNTASPDEVTYASHQKAFWVCGTCENSYSATIKNRTIGGSGCSDCSGNTVSDQNSLSYNLPRHVLDWDSNKNKLSPNEVSMGSGKSYHWKCHKCLEEWNTTINNKKNTKEDCPYCSGQRLASWNNLEVDNPKLAKEFNVELNKITPDKVRRGTQDRFWWDCVKGHEPFLAAVSNRNLKNSGCPKCDKVLKSSYPEQAIYFYLSQIFKDAENGKIIYIEGKRTEADIYIESLKLVIEYDGWYWHKDKHDKDEEKNKRFNQEDITTIRIREEGLNATAFSDNLFINKVYEEELDGLIKRLFEYISSKFGDLVTLDQIELIEKINIEHNRDRSVIRENLLGTFGGTISKQ